MYAVVRTGGKQYLVSEGQEVLVERLKGEPSQKLQLNEVLFAEKDGKHVLGKPLVSGAKVHCLVVAQERGPKITVFKIRKRKNSKRKTGHRQEMTRLFIEKIEGLN